MSGGTVGLMLRCAGRACTWPTTATRKTTPCLRVFSFQHRRHGNEVDEEVKAISDQDDSFIDPELIEALGAQKPAEGHTRICNRATYMPDNVREHISWHCSITGPTLIIAVAGPCRWRAPPIGRLFASNGTNGAILGSDGRRAGPVGVTLARSAVRAVNPFSAKGKASGVDIGLVGGRCWVWRVETGTEIVAAELAAFPTIATRRYPSGRPWSIYHMLPRTIAHQGAGRPI